MRVIEFFKLLSDDCRSNFLPEINPMWKIEAFIPPKGGNRGKNKTYRYQINTFITPLRI